MITINEIEIGLEELPYKDLATIELMIHKERKKRLLMKDIATARKESLQGRTLIATNKDKLINIFMKILPDEN